MPRSMFSIKTDVKAWTRKMNRVNKELLPKAIVATVNRAGQAAHSRSIRNIKNMFTVRNPYTEGSMKFWPAKYRLGRSIDRINAITGSKSPYLPLQETGGVVRARRQRIPIPTTAARRGKTKAGVVAPAYRMSKIGQIGRGSKFFYMRTRKPGIFTRRGKRLIMIRDLSLRSYRLERRPWHSEAVKKYGNKRVMGQVFVMEAKRQLAKVR